MRARLGLPPVAGIARGFTSQGPASLPANAESMPVYQGTVAGRVSSPTTRADSPGGGRGPGGYNNARRTESPSVDLQGTTRIPRPGQQQQSGGARNALSRNAYGYGQGQGLAPPPSGAGSRISDAPSFEMDGKASYYAPGMPADSRENSVYEPLPTGRGVSGAYHEREWDMGGSRNGYPNSNSKFPPLRNAGGRIPSQDRDLPPPPPPPQSQDDSQDEEEEFEVIPGAEDANGSPDIPTPTVPLARSNSPPPVPRKSTDSYNRYTRPESALSSDSGLGIPRESMDSSAGGMHMQSSLFRTEAQELRARWTAQEKEKEEREEREQDQHQHHRSMGSGSVSAATRKNGGFFDRRKESVGTNASSEVQTPVSFGGSVARDSLYYMSESEFGGMRSDTGSAYGTSTSRRRRGRTKSMIAREREREEQEMERAAAELAARKRWQKEQQLREEMEEEDRKRVS